ncbi:MAG: hypothetical protein L0Y78_07100 [candidate division NC10 bacterium]|nr:hypothetical protein [candidate division NC10 bacterium]
MRGSTTLGNVVLTFVIGVLAGVSPFLFMQLLPSLLNPSLAFAQPNYLAIVLTGVLVGAIISVLYTKTFHERSPQEVFFAALGIPAILIATVSNVSTKSAALQAVNEAQVAASNSVLSPPPAAEPVSLEMVEPSKIDRRGSVFTSRAWAEESPGRAGLLLAQAGKYFVIVGRYTSEQEAWAALGQLNRERLKSELYFPKSLRVFRTGTGAYYVSYSGALAQEDAVKLFKLIRINDPQLTPEILREK